MEFRGDEGRFPANFPGVMVVGPSSTGLIPGDKNFYFQG
jgi:hypothetical protein